MKVKYVFSIVIAALCVCTKTSRANAETVQSETRMIVMTDIGGSDPDDTQSLIHLLVSLDQVELEGIISQHAWVPYGTGALDIINKLINGYESVLPCLQIHSKGFPSADYLRSIVKVGQPAAAMAGVGDGKDSDGSEWIIRTVDKDDARPIWISAWSGLNTLAQALWKVQKTRSKDELEKFVSKIRVYDVLGQDDAGAWIVKHFPQLTYIRNAKIYGWPPSDEWTKENVQKIGTLGVLYPNRIWATEGDSPAFMYCLNNGLNCPEHPNYGGWGGRFDTLRVAGIRGMDWVTKSGLDESQYDPYYMIPSAEEGSDAIIKWKSAILNDFAARMLWTVTDNYSQANHHPRIVIGRDEGKTIITKTVRAGKEITLDARRSFDPDGNRIPFKWSFYEEPSSYKGELTLDTSKEGKCSIAIPKSAAGHTIHVILELTDDGVPSLTAYRRFVISCNK
jgi:hypothetical protein